MTTLSPVSLAACAVCQCEIRVTEKDMVMLADSRSHGGKFKVVCSDHGQEAATLTLRRHILRFHTNPYSGSVTLIEPSSYEAEL
jgi:hypothetical protein